MDAAGCIFGDFMIAGKFIKKEISNEAKIYNVIKDIAKLKVFVGVPEDKTTRKGSQEINNAQLVYLHTNGSPLHKIPARPIIEPAIEAEDNKEAIAKKLGEAARDTLDGKKGDAKTALKQAGQIGQDAARGWFEDPRNGWAQNSELTALRKLKKLKGKARAEAMARISDGEAPEDVSRPLIDTGQLRKSIIWVMKDND